jgi:hypothetical protein
LFPLFVNGGETRWLEFLHGGSDEGGDRIYNVDNFPVTTTWIFMFPNDDIEVEMVPPSWNNFLQPLLRFVVVRSNHDERLMRISISPELMLISLGSDRLRSVSLLHWWQKMKKKDA